MSSGKGGKGADTGPMLEYGNKALALQERIYNEGKAAQEPYLAAGGAGLNELMMRLGLGGGTATNKTAAQIRQELAPSYTTQAAGPSSSYYVSPDGRLIDTSGNKGTFAAAYSPFDTSPKSGAMSSGVNDGRPAFSSRELSLMSPEQRGTALSQMGYKAYASPTSATVDTTGLDAAVQQAIADQQASSAAAQSNPLYGSLLKSFSLEDYQADPGYAFRLSEGNKALDRSLAASGQYMTPERQKALQAYGQNLASEEYGNAYNRYNTDQGNIFNRLAAITGIGQTATAANQQAGQQYGASASDLYTGMGNAITAANQAKAQRSGSMFNTLLGAGAQLGAAYLGSPAFAASDRRLKENIEPMGEENGFPIYKFNYIGQSSPMIGVMSDDVKEIMPEAVIQDSQGFDRVNYDMIGVKFRSVQ